MSKKPGVFNRVTPHPELVRSLPTAFKESRGTRKRYSFNFFKKLERKGEHSNLKRRKAVLFLAGVVQRLRRSSKWRRKTTDLEWTKRTGRRITLDKG